jgi:hypothetical protein
MNKGTTLTMHSGNPEEFYSARLCNGRQDTGKRTGVTKGRDVDSTLKVIQNS